MDRPMMGPAQQDQVGQVGRAAVQPGDQMVGLAPGKGPLATGDHAAAVADREGGALGGLDDPGGAAHIQRLAGGATEDRGQQGGGGLEPGGQAVVAAGLAVAAVATGFTVAVAAAGVLVVVVAGVAGDQDSGRGGVAG
jgi:hypothetical protein